MTVIVTKKRPRGYLPRSQVLPEELEIDGTMCRVDVVQGGPFKMVGDPIVQPGDGETVAHLKRFIVYPDPPTTTSADAAIARLVDQDLSSDHFADDRIAPISATHPAVGLYFASDDVHAIGMISRIEDIMVGLNIDMLDPEAVHAITGHDLGAHIEKVGRTTGYSSSTIWATNLTVPVQMHDERYFLFSRVVATWRFGWPGDSGSLVCLGGDGDTLLPMDVSVLQCDVMSSVGEMYDLPLAQDGALADRVRDEFLAQSAGGNLLIQTFYTNQHVILGRTQNTEAADSEKSYAQALYTKYHDFLIAALDNPDDPDLVVTQENLEDAQLGLLGMRLHLTEEEDVAFSTLFVDIMMPTLGMSFQQLIDYLNEPATVQAILDTLAPVPTIEIPGPFRGSDGG